MAASSSSAEEEGTGRCEPSAGPGESPRRAAAPRAPSTPRASNRAALYISATRVPFSSLVVSPGDMGGSCTSSLRVILPRQSGYNGPPSRHDGPCVCEPEPWGHGDRDDQGDIIPAIAAGPPARRRRPRHRPDAVPLSSYPVAMQGLLRKCTRGPPPGTAFAYRGRSRRGQGLRRPCGPAMPWPQALRGWCGAPRERLGADAVSTVNQARTLQVWRPEGVL